MNTRSCFTISILIVGLAAVAIISCGDVQRRPQQQPQADSIPDTQLTEAQVHAAIERFKSDTGNVPYSLDELCEKGYLDTIPSVPPGYQFEYDPFTGTVQVAEIRHFTSTRPQPAVTSPPIPPSPASERLTTQVAPMEARTGTVRPEPKGPDQSPLLQKVQQTPALQQETEQTTETIVYVTDTGKKYHSSGCQYLRKSKHAISLKDAKARGYTPCSRCSPPR